MSDTNPIVMLVTRVFDPLGVLFLPVFAVDTIVAINYMSQRKTDKIRGSSNSHKVNNASNRSHGSNKSVRHSFFNVFLMVMVIVDALIIVVSVMDAVGIGPNDYGDSTTYAVREMFGPAWIAYLTFFGIPAIIVTFMAWLGSKNSRP